MKTLLKTAVIVGVFLGSFSLSYAVSTFVVQQGGTGVTTFTSSQLIYGNGTNALSSVATTTFTPGLNLSYSGTLGALVGGVSGTFSISTTSLYGASGIPNAALQNSSFSTSYTGAISGDSTVNLGGTFTLRTPSYPFLASATSSVLTFTGGIVVTASSTFSNLTSGFVGNNNGLLYSFATSSIYSFTPSPFAWTPFTWGNSTSTVLKFPGFISSASSTLSGGTLTLTPLATAAGSFLAVDTNGVIIATTTISISNTSGYKDPVNYAATTSLPANTYLANVLTAVGNGALYVDGANPTAGQRILIKNESTQTNNGIYDVTTVGSAIAAYVLTRSSDYNTSAKIYPGVATYVLSGTTNGDTSWALTSAPPITLDTTNLTYTSAANGNIQIPVTVAQGGTGVTSFTGNSLLYSNSAGTAIAYAATSSLNIGGNAATVTLNANLSGAVTSSGSNVTAFGSQSAGVLGIPATGVLAMQATSTLYGLGIAGQVLTVSGGNPMWISTSTFSIGGNAGTATTLLTARTINGVSFNGSANITVASTTLLGDTNTWSALNVFNSTAKLSVGTSTPAWAFQVASSSGATAGATLALTDTIAAANQKHWLLTSMGGNFYIGTSSDAYATSTTPALTILPNGQVSASAVQNPTATTSPIVFNWNTTPNQVEYQIGVTAVTIQIINATTSQNWGSRKLVWICNPQGTAGAITWNGVEWIGTAPTQTTTGNQCDVYSLDVTHATSTTAYKVSGTAGTAFQ